MPELRVLALCKSQAVNGGLDEFDLKCPPISLEKALRKIFPHERCYAPREMRICSSGGD